MSVHYRSAAYSPQEQSLAPTLHRSMSCIHVRTSPQFLQWCLRLKKLKGSKQLWHSFLSTSDTQLGGSAPDNRRPHGHWNTLCAVYAGTCIHATPPLLGNSVTEDTQFSGTSLKVDENLADIFTMMLRSSSWQNRPEDHGQTIGRIAIHLQAGAGVLCILHALAR